MKEIKPMPKSTKKTPVRKSESLPSQELQVMVPRSIEYVKGPQYSAFYSNNVAFGVSPLDFVMTFSETIDATADRAVLEQRARITMHPTQAKVLMILLMRNIQGYESMNGTINIPPDAIGILGAQEK
jgi:hypothetical protein